MARPGKRSFWQTCRIYFRRFRIAVWLLILILVGALVYLNQIGLPEFVKKPLLEKLRGRGVDLQFSRLRWRLPHGIVAENARFGPAGETSGPNLTAKELQVRLDYAALAKLRLQVNSLLLRQGDLSWTIAETNGSPRRLSLKNIQAELRFLPDDLWELQNFRADFAGAKIQLSGAVTNASAIREWKIFHGRRPPGATQGRLNQLADTLEQIHFSSPPELRAYIRGDARDLNSFAVQLAIHASGADTPWGIVTNGSLSAQLFAVASNGVPHAKANLTADAIETRWAKAKNLQLAGRFYAIGTNETARSQEIPYVEANLTADAIETSWGKAGTVQLTSRIFAPNTNGTMSGDESWGWWTNIATYSLDWQCRLSGLDSPRLNAGEISLAGRWRAPELAVSELSARLYKGSLEAQATLNVATREFSFLTSSDCDIQNIAPLLTEVGQRWLSQFSWQKPPVVKAEGALILPAWTNRQPDWRAEIQPTARLKGEFHIENGAFRGVTASSANSHFTYTNMFWSLPDLAVTQPDGRLDSAFEASGWTGNYHWRIHSTIDPGALRPLLETNQQRGLDFFTFTRPPVIDGEIWGHWNDPERIAIKASVALTNFTFRGESADGFQSTLEYSNQFLLLNGPHLQRGTQQASASGVGMDFAAKKVFLTNGFSTTEPMVVARAIGPQVVRVIEPYHFLGPPTVRVDGIIPMNDEQEADLHFDVKGGGFEWWKFKVPRISGRAHWQGERLTLSGVEMEFYQGTAAGSAEFDFHAGRETDFHFEANVTNADFHALMADLYTSTNRLEGKLTAGVDVSGNAADWESLQGKGHVRLKDGLIWEIPIFGILSPVLDSVTPGWGSSRASEGSAAFVITNGVLQSDNLEIRASAMRLQYRGTVDLRGKVDARVEAELLRDTWGIGRVLSAVLWPVTKIFEYKITGTVHQPKIEPASPISKFLLMPLHPFRTIKDFLPENPAPPNTNSPPAKIP